jgi:hypothetical protein
MATLRETIEQLLHESESTTLDFKAAQYALAGATDEQKSEIIKDILAFANTQRSADAHILLGVKENKRGRAIIAGVSHHLDDAHLQQLVNVKTNRTVLFSYHAVEIDEQQIGIITIPPGQARPFYLTKPYGNLDADTIYVRHGSSTSKATLDQLFRMGIEQQRAEDQRHAPVINALQRLLDHARFYQRIVRLWENFTRIPGHYVTANPRPASYDEERRRLQVQFGAEHDAFRQVIDSARDLLQQQREVTPTERMPLTEILVAMRDVEQTVNTLASWTHERLLTELPRDKQQDAAQAAERLSTLVAQRLA